MILADKIMEERKRTAGRRRSLRRSWGCPGRRFPNGRVPVLARTCRGSFKCPSCLASARTILLKDEMEPDGVYQEIEPTMERRETVPVRSVSMEEANDFLDRKKGGSATDHQWRVYVYRQSGPFDPFERNGRRPADFM